MFCGQQMAGDVNIVKNHHNKVEKTFLVEKYIKNSKLKG